ncbi:hypothetical protein [Thermoflavimicrobium daqui]|uniref:Entry exclusion lipoprotein TrbK n=1 Tax=Thermoflavimicrobium daqui TaxID=2137476 RepID=A0A364K4V0_9BACL|nr:hypothetical protein [Thermoflavimicrobium daqui]RAL24400.1 hypothetical protein DL897_08730 [Thermoflavimicrobium daqui]
MVRKQLISLCLSAALIISLTACGDDDGFVASVNSDVYHPANCKVVDKIKKENRIYFKTEEAAKKSGRHRSDVKECWK